MNRLDDFMDGAGKDGVITVDEIRAFSEKYSKITEDILDETLKTLGVSVNHSLTIQTDEKGMVKVNSDLSAEDNDRLEAALNQHPDFQQAYKKASSNKALLNAVDQYLEFAQAYAKDPKAAVARYKIGDSQANAYVLQYAQGQASWVL